MHDSEPRHMGGISFLCDAAKAYQRDNLSEDESEFDFDGVLRIDDRTDGPNVVIEKSFLKRMLWTFST